MTGACRGNVGSLQDCNPLRTTRPAKSRPCRHLHDIPPAPLRTAGWRKNEPLCDANAWTADPLPKVISKVNTTSLSILTAAHWVTVHWIMALAAFAGLLSAFEVPTRQAMVVDLPATP